MLYRVAQEALTNIARHSQARTAQVSLGQSDGQVTLTVSDDGVGFDADQALQHPNGLGLAAIGDIAPFPIAKHLVGYAGLGAKVHDSGQGR